MRLYTWPSNTYFSINIYNIQNKTKIERLQQWNLHNKILIKIAQWSRLHGTYRTIINY